MLLSFTMTDAERGFGRTLAAMATESTPAPCPDVGLSVSQGASVDAAQLQSRVTVTLSETLEPEDGSSPAGAVSPIWHRTPLGETTCSLVVPPHAANAKAAAAHKNPDLQLGTCAARMHS
jgi:hypothetical protein